MAFSCLVSLIATVLVIGANCRAKNPPNDRTLNQAITESAVSSFQLDFLQDNKTLMVEMDMKMSLGDWQNYHESKKGNGRQKRKGITGNRWPNNIIPYEEIPETFSGQDRKNIFAAFEDYHKYTCITFQPSNGRGGIYFVGGGGCSSYVGMTAMSSRRQPVTLAKSCRTKAIIIHELGHAVGLHHEQTRPDRDGYVEIQWNNVDRSMAYNFEKNPSDDLGVTYDYLSIMHYDQTAFSKNGGVTMVARQREFQDKMGRSSGFSFADIKIINLMYNCGGNCPRMNCPGSGFVGKDCKCWCPGNPVSQCGGGSGGGGGGGGSGGGGGGSGGGCSDSNRDCSNWARQGHCNNREYMYWMRQNCQKSCGICGRSSFSKKASDCMDQFKKCAEWAKKGECKTNPVYMNDYCSLSCNACTKTSTYSRVGCKDLHNSCATWAKAGVCEQNEQYMKETCPKSCDDRCKKVG